jgi:hypothetical protein
VSALEYSGTVIRVNVRGVHLSVPEISCVWLLFDGEWSWARIDTRQRMPRGHRPEDSEVEGEIEVETGSGRWRGRMPLETGYRIRLRGGWHAIEEWN